jgi:hypothetical protein
MSLLKEIPPEERPRISRRTLLLLVAGGSVGTVFGVVLAIVSIILPWKVLQRRVEQRSRFFGTFDPVGMVRRIGPPGVVWTSDEEDLKKLNLGFPDERPWARLIRISGIGLKHDDQDPFVRNFSSQIRSNPSSWYSGPSISPYSIRETSNLPDPSRFFGDSTIGYQVGEVQGFVHIWAVGHGDGIELLIAIQEP